MAQTIREIIAQKSLLLREVGEMGPVKASEELVELTSLLASLNSEISDTLYWLNIKRQEKLNELGSAAKARIASDASPEWKAWSDRMLQKEALVELIRAVKYFCRASGQEYQMTPKI